jgi:predicted nucleic-acid-binding protein
VIGLDTNVLVRYLTQDDPEQSPVANAFVDDALEAGEMLFVSVVVTCELVWVLDAAYGFARREIATALTSLFRARQIELEQGDAQRRALNAYREGPGDYADYAIRETCSTAGCGLVVTFDGGLLGERGFSTPGDDPGR